MTATKAHPMEAPDPMETPDRLANGALRCKARNKQGNRCGKAAMKGGTVCRNHGGAAPQVKQSARARLAAAVDPALDVLVDDLKAKKPMDRQRAANSILDRAGISRVHRMEVSDAKEELLKLLLELGASDGTGG